MRRRRITGERWVDVYDGATFGGKVWRLGRGQRTTIDKVGSMIIGPKARVTLLTKGGRELCTLASGAIVQSTSELAAAYADSYLRVS
jgi:hypothetical protein